MHYEFTGLSPRMVKAEIDGFTLEARTGKQIITLYRHAVEREGGRALPGWEDRVMEAIRENHPRYVAQIKGKGSGGVSLAGAKSYLKFVLRGGLSAPLVDRAEAMRRMEICKACPKSEPVLSCAVCKNALSSVKIPEVLDGPDACGACGCWLAAKVWIQRKFLGDAKDFPFWTGDESGPKCWMHE